MHADVETFQFRVTSCASFMLGMKQRSKTEVTALAAALLLAVACAGTLYEEAGELWRSFVGLHVADLRGCADWIGDRDGVPAVPHRNSAA
jgi:hypothetical protein